MYKIIDFQLGDHSWYMPLRDSIIIVTGESSAGKTLWIAAVRKYLRRLPSSDKAPWGFDSIDFWDASTTEETIRSLEFTHNHLIFVDSADFLSMRFSTLFRNFCLIGKDNCYVLMGRDLSEFRLHRQWYAEVVYTDNLFTLKYLENPLC